MRGRHPLPDRNNWLETVRNLGIKTNDQIVAYDDVGGMYAARFWWMMRWLGHENVAILDGGIQQWEGNWSPVKIWQEIQNHTIYPARC